MDGVDLAHRMELRVQAQRTWRRGWLRAGKRRKWVCRLNRVAMKNAEPKRIEEWRLIRVEEEWL
ncbi:hypothetical protein T4A_9659 [Trichinella pseudospiralis]|uniref:Uncharacterized protein n=1 Tax=Trichinella pseudospiralis TaxID=6337 RepID=A0A0V1D3G7_TRIPS|nr:hypothetical protein T4A_9659 [Trichinella pseudospiralis]